MFSLYSVCLFCGINNCTTCEYCALKITRWWRAFPMMGQLSTSFKKISTFHNNWNYVPLEAPFKVFFVMYVSECICCLFGHVLHIGT